MRPHDSCQPFSSSPSHDLATRYQGTVPADRAAANDGVAPGAWPIRPDGREHCGLVIGDDPVVHALARKQGQGSRLTALSEESSERYPDTFKAEAVMLCNRVDATAADLSKARYESRARSSWGGCIPYGILSQRGLDLPPPSPKMSCHSRHVMQRHAMDDPGFPGLACSDTHKQCDDVDEQVAS